MKGKVTEKHGMRKCPEYASWSGMKDRCFNANSHLFGYYGGRGITVCERWKDSFTTFLADMGPRPSPAYSLDRYPDKNGPYSPGNCRWATDKEQANNRRSNRHFYILNLNSLQVESFTIADIAEQGQLNPKTVRNRLRLGWPIERLGEPCNKSKRNRYARNI